MSDNRLRALERTYKESGDPAAEGRWVRELIRVRGLPVRGTWKMVGSFARLSVETHEDGTLAVEAWDARDYERFEVLGALWDGEHLQVHLRMPSTDYTTTSTLRLTKEHELSGTCSGGFEGPELWMRVIEA